VDVFTQVLKAGDVFKSALQILCTSGPLPHSQGKEVPFCPVFILMNTHKSTINQKKLYLDFLQLWVQLAQKLLFSDYFVLLV